MGSSGSMSLHLVFDTGFVDYISSRLEDTNSVTYDQFYSEFSASGEEEYDAENEEKYFNVKSCKTKPESKICGFGVTREYINRQMWEAAKLLIDEYPHCIIWDTSVTYDKTCEFYRLNKAKKLWKGAVKIIADFKAMDVPMLDVIGEEIINTLLVNNKYVTAKKTFPHLLVTENGNGGYKLVRCVVSVDCELIIGKIGNSSRTNLKVQLYINELQSKEHLFVFISRCLWKIEQSQSTLLAPL